MNRKYKNRGNNVDLYERQREKVIEYCKTNENRVEGHTEKK